MEITVNHAGIFFILATDNEGDEGMMHNQWGPVRAGIPCEKVPIGTKIDCTKEVDEGINEWGEQYRRVSYHATDEGVAQLAALRNDLQREGAVKEITVTNIWVRRVMTSPDIERDEKLRFRFSAKTGWHRVYDSGKVAEKPRRKGAWDEPKDYTVIHDDWSDARCATWYFSPFSR